MNDIFSLKGKTFVITGASSGIGRQCAIAASQFGANVVLVGKDYSKLEYTFKKLSKGDHLMFSQDLTEYAKLEELIIMTIEKIGKISGFVHSAGIEMTLPLRNLKPHHFEEAMSINAISAFELGRIISKKKYVSEKGASFIFIASIMGKLGQVGKVGYCSSKGAMISGAMAMALELASKKIRVNCILPGLVETEMSKKLFEVLSEDSISSIKDMHPLGFGYPEDIANTVLFMLSDASRWITGTSLIIDGGYSAK